MHSTLCVYSRNVAYLFMQEDNTRGTYGEVRNVCFATFCVDAETMPGCPSRGLQRLIMTPSTYLEI